MQNQAAMKSRKDMKRGVAVLFCHIDTIISIGWILTFALILLVAVATTVAESIHIGTAGSTTADGVSNVNVNHDAVEALAKRWIRNPFLLEQIRFEELELDDDTGNNSSNRSKGANSSVTRRQRHDVFEYEAGGSESDVPPKVIIRGTTTAALTAGLGWYLKYECNVQLSWTGDQLGSLERRTSLPIPREKVRHRRNGSYSYYQNVCTVSYSMVWWDVDRWYRELDWMALSGINFPLAFQGQEIVWQQTFLALFAGDSYHLQHVENSTGGDKVNDEILTWLGGPAFMAWQRMGNIQAWGGPMPQSWIDQQYTLQMALLERMTELGMKPVLPAFAGFVPPITQHYFPDAKISLSNSWGGFNSSYTPVNIVEPTDALFQRIGEIFQKTYRRLYSDYFSATVATTHYYNADTYNEMDPKHGDLPYLRQASKAVFDSIRSVDETGVWVMQGWLFVSSGFWTKERMLAYLSGVDDEQDDGSDDRMDRFQYVATTPLAFDDDDESIENDERLIILDLMSDVSPQYGRSDYYFGKSYIYNMLHNFGGNHGLYGRMQVISTDPAELFQGQREWKRLLSGNTPYLAHTQSEAFRGIKNRASKDAREIGTSEDDNDNNIQGVGLTMEGINQNFAVYDLMTEMSWRNHAGLGDDEFLSHWIDDYVTRRYGLVPSTDILSSTSSESKVRLAWQQLLKTVYTCPTTQYGVTKNVAVRRPRMDNMTHDGFMPTALFYDPRDLQVAWKLLLDSDMETSLGLSSLETYRYDLADVTRQCLSDLLLDEQIEMWQAYERHDLDSFSSSSSRFMEILTDIDKILSTHELFLFETQWLAPARAAAGPNDTLADFYEFNAKNQVTMWGPEGEISDYASKQFAGLVGHYYHTRWSMFVDTAKDAMHKGVQFNNSNFEEECKHWEKKWQYRQHKYPDRPVGDTTSVSVDLYRKYVAEASMHRTDQGMQYQ